MTYPASTLGEAVVLTTAASNQLHQIINDDATTSVPIEDGSLIPTVRKAILDNLFLKNPIPWSIGATETVFNQLRNYTDGTWWYAPTSASSTPVTMGTTPYGDSNWRMYSVEGVSAVEPIITEILRRSYAEVDLTLVAGSFKKGGVLASVSDVLLDENSGKCYSWGGPFPKNVTPETDPISGGYIDQHQKVLYQLLTSQTGASIVNDKLSGSSTVQQNQHDINEVVYNIDRWGGNLSKALDEIPAGCVLQLNNYSYLGNIHKYRSDITIRGTGMGWYNAGKTAIVGGSSRITGTLALTGNNVHVENVSVDSGSDVCAAINSGNPMDALVINDPTRQLLYNCSVKNVITLCQSPLSAAHNFLLEGLSDSYFENLHARYGQWGIVMKTESSHLVGGNAHACSQAGFTAKSDTGIAGSPCVRSSASQVYVDNSEYPSAEQGVLIYAASYGLDDFKLTDSTVMYGKIGYKLLCDPRSGANFARKVSMKGLTAIGQTVYSFESFGACVDSFVDNFVFDGCVSNNAIQVDLNCLGINISNGVASVPVASATTVNLAGRFTLNNIRSVVTSDFNSKSGINISPEASNLFSYNNNIGTLSLNGAVGWTPSFTNLTVSNGTGGVTYSGSFDIIDNYIKWQAQIDITGTATTSSTASVTRINNLPFAALQNEPFLTVNNSVATIGIGLCQLGGTNAFTPAWVADNNNIYMSGMYRFK